MVFIHRLTPFLYLFYARISKYAKIVIPQWLFKSTSKQAKKVLLDGLPQNLMQEKVIIKLELELKSTKDTPTKLSQYFYAK